MARKDHYSKTADNLINSKDASEKLLAFAGRASGLTAFLVNKSKEDVLKNEVEKKLPVLKERLEERRRFFERKEVKNDNIRNLTNEISKCDHYINNTKEDKNFKDILDWYYKIWEKYGF